ncbi:hypothetical protein ACJX0J_019888, partial [Zea mays]
FVGILVALKEILKTHKKLIGNPATWYIEEQKGAHATREKPTCMINNKICLGLNLPQSIWIGVKMNKCHVMGFQLL